MVAKKYVITAQIDLTVAQTDKDCEYYESLDYNQQVELQDQIRQEITDKFERDLIEGSIIVVDVEIVEVENGDL